MSKPYYEILVRGWPDAQVNPSACHIKYWEQKGIDASGDPTYAEGLPEPITAQELQAYLGDQYAAAAAQIAQLTDEKSALVSERDALAQQVATIAVLKEQIRVLKGTPTFIPSKLLAEFSPDDLQNITTAAAAAPDTLQYYFALQNRATTTNAPIPIDSEAFLAALVKLKAAVGDSRTAELFTALNIDLATGVYIDPAQAA